MEYQRFHLHDRRKTETATKQTAEKSSSVEVCASGSGFLSTWNTVRGLRHLECGDNRVSKVSQTSDLQVL